MLNLNTCCLQDQTLKIFINLTEYDCAEQNTSVNYFIVLY